MSNLSLRHIYKVYPNGVKAVNDFNMEIEDKEFIVFVGPSGCGKSTTLRMIAGLEEITAGELYIGDSFVNRVEPKDRDIAMVFQNYALYPHMTVYENLAFGLRLRHVPQTEIHKKVLWAAKVLRLEEYLDRKPKALSGGQRQRVSLGRAILRTPKVFLLDEPLSNLDAKLRTEMRAEIAKLHNEIETTFIYVTHDQVEAMTMGTRIVVMSMGYVQQIDTPQNLYNYPENKFVAGFIGTPQMNFFLATLKREGNTVKVKFEGTENVLEIPFSLLLKVRPEYLKGDKQVYVGLRCEHISADPEIVEKSVNTMKVKISHFEELGNETLIYGDLNMAGDGLSESNTRVIVKQYGGSHTSKIGDIIDVAFDMSRAHFFDFKTEKTIAPRIPEENVFDASVINNELVLLGNNISLPQAIKAQLKGDIENGTLIIPTNSLFVGGKDLVAKVVESEVINKTIIVHLQIEDRTFFMISDKEYAVGEELSLGIDFKNITIADNDETIVAALPTYDTFYGSYFDRTNAKRSVTHLVKYYQDQKKKELDELNKELNGELIKVVLLPEILKEIKKEYAEKKKEILGNMSYRLGTESLGKEGKKKVKEEAQDDLWEAKRDYDGQVAHYNRKKAEFENLSDSEKQARTKDEQVIRDKFAVKKKEIDDRYAAIIAEIESNIGSVDGVLLPIEKQNAEVASKETANANAEYEKKIADTEAMYSENIKKAEADVATMTGTEKDVAVIALKEAKRAKIDGMKAIVAEKNAVIDDVLFRSKVFAAYINGHTFVSSLDINKKIVKGLGAQLFLSHYRFEMPHDAYVIAEGGIKVRVEDIIDYGMDKYAKCSLHGESIYVKVDKDYNVGDTLSINLDIEKARIFENLFDIRLY